MLEETRAAKSALKSVVSALNVVEPAPFTARKVDEQPQESTTSSIGLLAERKSSGSLNNGKIEIKGLLSQGFIWYMQVGSQVFTMTAKELFEEALAICEYCNPSLAGPDRAKRAKPISSLSKNPLDCDKITSSTTVQILCGFCIQ